jgi:hypothetical protein
VIRGEKGGGAEVPVSGLYKKGLGMSGELQKNTKIKKSKINKVRQNNKHDTNNYLNQNISTEIRHYTQS